PATLQDIIARAAVQLGRQVDAPHHFDGVVARLAVDENAVDGWSERLPQLDVVVLLIDRDLEAVASSAGLNLDPVVAHAAADDKDALARIERIGLNCHRGN